MICSATAAATTSTCRALRTLLTPPRRLHVPTRSSIYIRNIWLRRHVAMDKLHSIQSISMQSTQQYTVLLSRQQCSCNAINLHMAPYHTNVHASDAQQAGHAPCLQRLHLTPCWRQMDTTYVLRSLPAPAALHRTPRTTSHSSSSPTSWRRRSPDRHRVTGATSMLHSMSCA